MTGWHPQAASSACVCSLAPWYLSFFALTTALSKLQALQHLTCSSDQLQAFHLSSLTSLHNLTSLSVSNSPKEAPACSPNNLRALLQHLAKLSRLHSLVLSLSTEPEGATKYHLPAWPSLRRLHLQAGTYTLYLTAQQCAQLEGLTACKFQAAAGVASMAALRSLRLEYLPVAWSTGAAAPQQGQQGPLPTQQLQYPQLRQLAAGKDSSEPAQLCRFLELASQAPLLQELDLYNLSATMPSPKLKEQHEAQQDAVGVLLAAKQRLASLRLPSYTLSPRDAYADSTRDAGSREDRVLMYALSTSSLAHLALQNVANRQQLKLLAAATTLRELSLLSSWDTSLGQLPRELTALTCSQLWESGSTDLVITRASHLPPLRKLMVDKSDSALRHLRLARLTCLTSLTVRRQQMAYPTSEVSKLVALEEADVPWWPSLAWDLQGLSQLRRLTINSGMSAVMEEQVKGLSRLTQLTQLVLGDASVPCAQRVVKELLLCLVRLQQWVAAEQEMEL